MNRRGAGPARPGAFAFLQEVEVHEFRESRLDFDGAPLVQIGLVTDVAAIKGSVLREIQARHGET